MATGKDEQSVKRRGARASSPSAAAQAIGPDPGFGPRISGREPGVCDEILGSRPRRGRILWRGGGKSRSRGVAIARRALPTTMPPTPFNRDPEGYYAQLGVDPWATPDSNASTFLLTAVKVNPAA